MFIDWENIKYSLLNRENRLPNVQALKEAAGRFGRLGAEDDPPNADRCQRTPY